MDFQDINILSAATLPQTYNDIITAINTRRLARITHPQAWQHCPSWLQGMGNLRQMADL